ncbi:MAG: sulfotransferase [Flavobacteriales bacterium]|nr:sulfotransferase [Flavobacteriales bacterium]
MDLPLILVVGAPRSGTTWLHHMLATHPDVASQNEELTIFTYLGIAERRFLNEKHHLDAGHWRQGAPLLYTETEFYQGLRAIAGDVYGRLHAKKPEAKHLLDKHPDYARHLPLVQKLFPNAKVIHLIRDGREVVVSMMSAKKRLGFGAGEIQGATRHWATNLLAARQAEKLLGPGQYMEVRYEELKAETATGMKAVFNFCQLPVTDDFLLRITEEYDIRNKQVSRGDATLNPLRDKSGAIWQAKLSLEERWTMDRLAGHLLQDLRYAKPGWWALRPGDNLRMAFLSNLRRLKNTLGSAKHTWMHSTPQRSALPSAQ